MVDFYLAQIIDLFVKPDNPIVDYNTKWVNRFPVLKEVIFMLTIIVLLYLKFRPKFSEDCPFNYQVRSVTKYWAINEIDARSSIKILGNDW